VRKDTRNRKHARHYFFTRLKVHSANSKKRWDDRLNRFSITYTELHSIYCRGTAIRMKVLPELLDCIVSKCFLHQQKLNGTKSF